MINFLPDAAWYIFNFHVGETGIRPTRKRTGPYALLGPPSTVLTHRGVHGSSPLAITENIVFPPPTAKKGGKRYREVTDSGKCSSDKWSKKKVEMNWPRHETVARRKHFLAPRTSEHNPGTINVADDNRTRAHTYLVCHTYHTLLMLLCL